MAAPEDRSQTVPHPVRRLVRVIVLTGVLAPGVFAVVIRTWLAAQGIRVVGWAQGAVWMLPVTLIFLIPFLVLAMLVRAVLARKQRRGVRPFRRWWYVSVGAFLGLSAVYGYLLATLLPSFETIAEVVAFWPFTVPFIFLFGIAGVLTGGLTGWVVWLLRGRVQA